MVISPSIEILLRCYLSVLVITEVISGFNDHIHHEAFLHAVEFFKRKAQLLGPQHKYGCVYFPFSWATPFFGFDVVLRDPR